MTSTGNSEVPLVFSVDEQHLIGVLHLPENARAGFVLVSGGDQYRVGSHRLFVELARTLADAGVAVLRFDHRGVGDSVGPYAGFENLGDDIDAAIDELKKRCPDLERIVLGGLCDGASASLIAVENLNTVDEVILINPWVHTNDLEARARLVNYYSARLSSRDFWKKLIRGQLQFTESWKSLMGYTKMFFQSLFDSRRNAHGANSYVSRMQRGAKKFSGSIYILLSGQDLVAQQFQQLVTIDKSWKDVLEKPTVHIAKLPGADHTFSTKNERKHFEGVLLQWFEAK